MSIPTSSSADGKRTRIDFADGGFKVEGKFVSQICPGGDGGSELRRSLRRMCSCVRSSKVTFSQRLIYFAGPAEAAYFAQMPELFELFGEVPPVIYPRFSATIIERNIAALAWKSTILLSRSFLVMWGNTINESHETHIPADFDSMFADLRD